MQAFPTFSIHWNHKNFHRKINSANTLQAPDSSTFQPLHKIKQEAAGVRFNFGHNPPSKTY